MVVVPASGGGGKVLSPWNISPRSTRRWVGARGKNVVLPKGTNSGIFHIQLGKFRKYCEKLTKILGNEHSYEHNSQFFFQNCELRLFES